MQSDFVFVPSLNLFHVNKTLQLTQSFTFIIKKHSLPRSHKIECEILLSLDNVFFCFSHNGPVNDNEDMQLFTLK